ncbi:MAG: IS5/IS1182 family transposase, partial [Methanomicrobiales archaeon]|nr:IS5/IS1182 family transposase [Methanomicrobiales archaeon]
KPWSKEVGYGKRWAVEGVFSAVKRIFGESVKSTSIQGMYHEVMQKY